MIQLPYFDSLLEKFSKGAPEAEQTFGLNVHWGYWQKPKEADGSYRDFHNASRQLTRKVYEKAKIKDGMKVLDVGCGFGGTIHELNENFTGMDLVGLNIDPRQLARAREKVKAKKGNKISFIEGNACKLPFPDASFDAVLAVECIFHFPSRFEFLKEVKRVLRPGGRLAISDFVPFGPALPSVALVGLYYQKNITDIFGKCNSAVTKTSYRLLSKAAGFKKMKCEDITEGTLPTYPVIEKLGRDKVLVVSTPKNQNKVNSLLYWASRLRLVRYMVLDFAKEA